jgi:chromosome segregation ATPase
VVNKKHERDALKECEDDLRAQIAGLEKEIIPEINKLFNTKEALKHQKNLKAKYEGEIDGLKKEIDDQRDETTKRVEEIMNENQNLINKIKSLELENNDLRSDIIISKTVHKKEKEELEKNIKVKKEEQTKLVDKLTELKGIYDKKKKDQAEKLRKMENKSKMFLGILKH